MQALAKKPHTGVNSRWILLLSAMLLMLFAVFGFDLFAVRTFLNTSNFENLSNSSAANIMGTSSTARNTPVLRDTRTTYSNDMVSSRNRPHQCVLTTHVDEVSTSSSGIHIQGNSEEEDEDTNSGFNGEYPFNARMFCIASAMCITPRRGREHGGLYFGALPSETTCKVTGPSLARRGEEMRFIPNCTRLQETVHCAHGAYITAKNPACGVVRPLAEVPKGAKWMDGVAIIVPAYPYLGNIFHFSYPAAVLTHVASSLPALLRDWTATATASASGSSTAGDANADDDDDDDDATRNQAGRVKAVTVVLRTAPVERLGAWQTGVLQALLQYRLKALNVSVSVRSTHEDAELGDRAAARKVPPALCARTAVLLGQRFNVNLWPFPNAASRIADSAHVVPVEALAFRAALYAALGIPSRNPDVRQGALGASALPQRALLDLPPRAVGYARRDGGRDPLPGEHAKGRTRRFSDADEAWLLSMLRNETTAANFSLTTVQTNTDVPFSAQVSMFRGFGVVVGIHGANLVNAMFSPAFSSLLEVSSIPMSCYIWGANAGLAYWTYKTVRVATVEESACPPWKKKCMFSPNGRRVIISESRDHERLTELAREAIAHVNVLHERFGHLGGVPVLYREERAEYSIDWEAS